MKNRYDPLIGYVIWITREPGSSPERRYLLRAHGMIMPKTEQKFKVTLRNVKLYLDELKEIDPTITEVCIDKLSRVGIQQWDSGDGQAEGSD